MGFFEYFIRYTLVRALNRFLKPKYLIGIVIILLVLILLFNNQSHAIYTGNDTYTDPYNSINLAYNSLGNDLIYRLNNFTSNDNNYNNLLGLLKNSDFGYYIYYGQNDGLNMINSNTYVQDDLWVCFYYLGNPSTSIATSYDNYQGLDCSIIINNGVSYCYRISSDSIDVFTGISVYMPSVLYNYRLDIVTNYLFNKSQEQNNSVIDAINQQTNTINEQTTAINEQTNSINEQNNFLQAEPDSQDFSSSDLPSDNTQDITQSGVNNIFTMFYDTFTRPANGDDMIEVPVPFTGKKFYIMSNYTSSYVPTDVKSIINMFWYFVVSVYIVKDILNKIQKIKTGDMESMQNSNIKGDLL